MVRGNKKVSNYLQNQTNETKDAKLLCTAAELGLNSSFIQPVHVK